MKLEPLSATQFKVFAAFLEKRFQLEFSAHNKSQLTHAVRRRCRTLGIDDPLHYLSRLQSESKEEAEFIRNVTTGETYFFRYPAVNQFVQHQIMELSCAGKGHAKMLHIGCSTGEEPYTIAMVLDQMESKPSVLVNALDLNRSAVTHAQRGRYRKNAFRGIKSADMNAYFRERGEGEFELAPRIRSRVSFHAMDVFQLPESHLYQKYDFIFCMNVLIYLGETGNSRLIHMLKQMMDPETRLILAPTDFNPLWSSQFQVERQGACTWYKLPEVKSAPAPVSTRTVLPPVSPAPAPRGSPARPASVAARPPVPPTASVNNAYLLGKRAYEQKQFSQAKKHFDHGILNEEQVEACYLGLAKVYADEGNLHQAADNAELALAIDPDNDEVHLLLGTLNYQANNAATAKTHFERALRLNPANKEARQFLAILEP